MKEKSLLTPVSLNRPHSKAEDFHPRLSHGRVCYIGRCLQSHAANPPKLAVPNEKFLEFLRGQPFSSPARWDTNPL